MADTNSERWAKMFPRLSAAQIARLEAVGRRRRVDRGEIIIEQGTVAPDFFVVISGRVAAEGLVTTGGPSGPVAIVQLMDDKALPVEPLSEGQFTGEVSLVLGRSTLVRVRVVEPGELLQITPDALRRI